MAESPYERIAKLEQALFHTTDRLLGVMNEGITKVKIEHALDLGFYLLPLAERQRMIEEHGEHNAPPVEKA